MPVVYLAGPIKGMSYDMSVRWRKEVTNCLNKCAIKTSSPMRDKEYLDGITRLDAAYENHLLSTQRSIMTRDFYDCTHADMVMVNFSGGYDNVSIGTVMEIAWAYQKQIPVVCIMPKPEFQNIHDHPMIREAISYRVETVDDAIMVVKSVLLPYV